MLNEEKISLMTKLALYEQGEGKKALGTNKYKKSDYVALKIISTVVLITIAYFLIAALWVVHKIDYYVDKLVSMDYVSTGIRFLVGYVVIMVVYILIAYIVYSVKYIKMQEMNQKYSEDLKELYLMYKREERMKNETKTGGNISDDGTYKI